MIPSEYAALHGLTRVGARPGLPQYLQQVWQRRAFVFALARSRIQAKNQENVLGLWWLVITPIMDALVYGTVFGILQGSKRPEHFIQFLLIGIFLFRYFSESLSAGSRAIISNRSLVQSLSFPRMVLPLAVALEHVINFVPVLVLLLLLSLVLGAVPTWNWLLMAPAVLLLVLFNTGIILLVARIAVHFRDIGQIIPFTNRFLRYFSGVFYVPAAFVGHLPILMLFFEVNPVYDLLELARFALIPDYSISLTIAIGSVAWPVAIFTVGSLFFWSAEELYGRVS